MNLGPFVDDIHRQLVAAADTAGDEGRALAERIYAPVEAAVRLTLQDALAAAAEEITCELAPGSVEVRLRGRQPEFVVNLPAPAVGEDEGMREDGSPGLGRSVPEGDDGAMARINLRMPDHLKNRIEQAAAVEGLSVNSWLVRAASAALERSDPPRTRARHTPQGPQRYTGWAR